MNYMLFNEAVEDTVKDFIRCSWHYSSSHVVITSFNCVALASTLTNEYHNSTILLSDFLMYVHALMLCR